MATSLIRLMAQASKLRRGLKKAGHKIPKMSIGTRKGLRGGRFAKRQAIQAAHNVEGLIKKRVFKKIHGPKKGAKMFYGYSKLLQGSARAQFGKRYPGTQMAFGATKVAGIGALGAWILNDGDSKKKS